MSDLLLADVRKALKCLRDAEQIEVRMTEPGFYRWRTPGGEWSGNRYASQIGAHRGGRDDLMAVARAFLEREVPTEDALGSAGDKAAAPDLPASDAGHKEDV